MRKLVLDELNSVAGGVGHDRFEPGLPIPDPTVPDDPNPDPYNNPNVTGNGSSGGGFFPDQDSGDEEEQGEFGS